MIIVGVIFMVLFGDRRK